MATSAIVDMSGWQALMRRVGLSTKAPKVAVGVFGDEELATIAATHEYGEESWHASGDGIPERSYLRSTMRERKVDIKSRLAQSAKMVLTGGGTVEVALGRLGAFAAGAVKTKIRSNIPPPLQLETIKRKGSSTALVDTGRLINAITWKLIP